MSASREREVIYEMIEVREALVRTNSLRIDELYNLADFNINYDEISACYERNSKLYDEILLLKIVIMAADNG